MTTYFDPYMYYYTHAAELGGYPSSIPYEPRLAQEPIDRPPGEVGSLVIFNNNDGNTMDGVILEVDDDGDMADIIVQPSRRWNNARKHSYPDVERWDLVLVYGIPKAVMRYAEAWSWKHRADDEPVSIYVA